MIRHHFIMVIQVATIVAELAVQEVRIETGAKDVVDVVVAEALLTPSLLTISVNFQIISVPALYKGGHS